jgi:hypothetical protein
MKLGQGIRLTMFRVVDMRGLGKVLCGRLPDCKQFHDVDWQV